MNANDRKHVIRWAYIEWICKFEVMSLLRRCNRIRKSDIIIKRFMH